MFTGSIVEYGVNGRDKRYGSNHYRGNTDGTIVKDFLDFCQGKFKAPVETCSDYMVGSGTTADVCKEKNIGGTWTDLRYGFNALTDEIPDRPQTIFWHPPYSEVIGIPYAGKEWSDAGYQEKYGFDPRKADLGRMPWDEFCKALSYCCMKFYSALETGGRMGILMGDIRRKGQYYSMLLDMARPSDAALESIVIKHQNHTTSGNKFYGKANFIPIEHEWFLILRKVAPYILNFSYIQKAELDIRDSNSATWKDVVGAVLDKLGNNANLNQIYAEIDGHAKAMKNPHWQEKVRQTLQMYPCFTSVQRGVWAAA